MIVAVEVRDTFSYHVLGNDIPANKKATAVVAAADDDGIVVVNWSSNFGCSLRTRSAVPLQFCIPLVARENSRRPLKVGGSLLSLSRPLLGLHLYIVSLIPL